MKPSKLITFPKSGIDFKRILTSFFMEGIVLIDLRGLIALIDLMPLREAFVPRGKNSNIADKTTKKSKIFQPSFK